MIVYICTYKYTCMNNDQEKEVQGESSLCTLLIKKMKMERQMSGMIICQEKNKNKNKKSGRIIWSKLNGGGMQFFLSGTKDTDLSRRKIKATDL